jgi:hypothetical protein
LVGVDEPEEVSVDPKTVERTVRAVSMWPLYLVIPFFYTKRKGKTACQKAIGTTANGSVCSCAYEDMWMQTEVLWRTKKSVSSSERQNTQCEAVSTYRRVERYDSDDPRPQELFRVLLVRLHAQYRVGYQQSSHTIKTKDSQLRESYITRERSLELTYAHTGLSWPSLPLRLEHGRPRHEP